jgi:hypothetical protein
MPDRARAEIAAMGFFKDEIDKRSTAKQFSEAPRFCLVAPHERGFENEAAVHPEVQSKLHGLDGIVPTIGITRIIGFAHSSKNMFKAAAIGEGCCKRQEQEISPRNKGVGQPLRTGFNHYVMGHRGFGDLLQGLDTDEVILAETFAPLRKIPADRLTDNLALVEFDFVPLAIVEADCLDEHMAIERQGKTGRRILAAGKQYKRAAGRHCEALANPVSSGSKTRNCNGKEVAFTSALSRGSKM